MSKSQALYIRLYLIYVQKLKNNRERNKESFVHVKVTKYYVAIVSTSETSGENCVVPLIYRITRQYYRKGKVIDILFETK